VLFYFPKNDSARFTQPPDIAYADPPNITIRRNTVANNVAL
jgi:hypothetical protein